MKEVFINIGKVSSISTTTLSLMGFAGDFTRNLFEGKTDVSQINMPFLIPTVCFGFISYKIFKNKN